MFPLVQWLRHCCTDNIMTQLTSKDQSTRRLLRAVCYLFPMSQDFISKSRTAFFLSSAIRNRAADSQNVSTASSLFNFLSADPSLICTFSANSGNRID